MSAWAARAPRRGTPTTYVMGTKTIPTARNGAGAPVAYRVESAPQPVHYATIKRETYNGLWVVKYPSVIMGPTHKYALDLDAIRGARDVVGRVAGRDWGRFTGVQRYAVGQGQCPGPMGSPRACGQLPEVGTIWCQWHPRGKDIDV